MLKDKEKLENAIKNANIYGLEIALESISESKTFDTLLLHGVHNASKINERILMQEGDALLGAVEALMRTYEIPHCALIINRDNREAVDLYFSMASGMKGVEVRPTKAEVARAPLPVIAQKIFGRKLRKNQKMADIGILAIDFETASDIGEFLASELPKTKKHIELVGDELEKPICVHVEIETKIKDILSKVNIKDEKIYRITHGHTAFDDEIKDLNQKITPQTSCLGFFSESACVEKPLAFWQKPLPKKYQDMNNPLAKPPIVMNIYNVLLALLPAMFCSIMLFGTQAIELLFITMFACVTFEWLFCVATKRKSTISDGSAIVTGALLALNFSANLPLYLAVVGAFFAIIVGKILCGGLGKNLINPAVFGYVVLLVVFPLEMSDMAHPDVLDKINLQTGYLATNHAEFNSWINFLFGFYDGAIGTVCAVAVLVGFAYLLFAKTISPRIPLAIMGTMFLVCWLQGMGTAEFLLEMFSGSLPFIAVFMASDPATAPHTRKGQMFYSVFIALLSICIINFSNYPQALPIAILFGNLLVPIFDGKEI